MTIPKELSPHKRSFIGSCTERKDVPTNSVQIRRDNRPEIDAAGIGIVLPRNILSGALPDALGAVQGPSEV
jgi:hypothetical protein